MNIKKKYTKAFEAWQAGDCEKALKLLNKVRANEIDTYYLEAAIYNKLGNPFKEYRALKKLLPLLPTSSPDYEEFLLNFSACCSDLCLTEEAFKIKRQIMNTTQDNKKFHEMIAGLCFDINAKENVTPADFHELYDKFRESFKSIPSPRAGSIITIRFVWASCPATSVIML